MKKDIKKVLAISALSLGFLSSVPSALCATGDANNTNNANDANRQLNRSKFGSSDIMIPIFHLSKTDFERYLFVSKKTGSKGDTCKVNPVWISSLRDVQKFVPNIETFEDYHTLTDNENIMDLVNKVDLNADGKLKTLIYHPQSFNVERFKTILAVNGITNDWRYAVAENLIDRNGKVVEGFCGNEWACIIYPFDGKYCRVEFTKGYYKKYLSDSERRKVVFLFSPTYTFDKNKSRLNQNENAIGIFNRLMDDYGLGGLVNIDVNAFQNCVFPKGINEIGKYVLRGCNTVKGVHITNGAIKIGEGAFECCTSLSRINIPNSVTEIGDGAFCECKSLQKVYIPNSVQEIKDYAFMDCKSLKEIVIPNGIRSVKECTFCGCKSLVKVYIPRSVREIGIGAFEKCKSLEEIDIPINVTEIKDYAFNGCKSLKKITLPDNIRLIGNGVFDGCISLDEIEWRGNVYHTVAEFFAAFNNRF